MRHIKELPGDVSSRIAAGEIIENPASVVKELMENSIDAASARIEIGLENGGKSCITVEDNGNGILCSELPLSIRRFATSKINDVDDLSRIVSFGYRGEALASICAVGRVEIRSFRPGSEGGGMLRASGGEILLHVPIQAQEGTRVQVEDLFFNLPARRNFLKSASAESRKVTALIRDYSAAFPEISFSVLLDGKCAYSSEGCNSRESVLGKIWSVSGDIRLNSFDDRGVHVEAAWSPSPGSRRRDMTVFINGRRVRETTVGAAVASTGDAAAGNWMFFINVPAELLDVNIHPGKMEVRVHSSVPLFESIRRVAGGLVEKSHVRPAFWGKGVGTPGKGVSASNGEIWNGNIMKNPEDLFSRVCEPPIESREDDIKPVVIPEISFIGQTGSGYLLYNGVEELIILDPHAAHERILFEQLVQRKGINSSQSISFPEQIPPTLSERIPELREPLEEAGFRFEDRSGVMFLKAIPEGSGSGYMNAPTECLRRWLSAIGDLDDKEYSEEKLPGMACRSAVKLGEKVSREEASRLIEDLFACIKPSMCPHGRPTMIRLKSADIARLFWRK